VVAMGSPWVTTARLAEQPQLVKPRVRMSETLNMTAKKDFLLKARSPLIFFACWDRNDM
jgi:hypothetical protein